MIRVLVVEDEPLTAEAHAEYLQRVPGFELAGVEKTGTAAVRRLAHLTAGETIDLVLLDMNLPDGSGLEVCRRFRAAGIAVDVIAITAVRDLAVVRQAIAVGIVQYLIKPFSFSAFADKLRNYAEYHDGLAGDDLPTTQGAVDAALSALRRSTSLALPKGLSAETLDAVTTLLRSTADIESFTSGFVSSTPPPPSPCSPSPRGWSAGELSVAAALSRVTARRYLEYLTSLGQVIRDPRHGGTGRPEIEYRWARS